MVRSERIKTQDEKIKDKIHRAMNSYFDKHFWIWHSFQFCLLNCFMKKKPMYACFTVHCSLKYKFFQKSLSELKVLGTVKCQCFLTSSVATCGITGSMPKLL